MYNLTTIAMYDADLREIVVTYMYKDSLESEGYEDYAAVLIDSMELIYDYS